MFCIRCGAELPDDAKFCPVCGMKIVYDDSESKNISEGVAEIEPRKEKSKLESEKVVLTLGKRKLEFPARMEQYVQHYHYYLQLKKDTCQNFAQEYSKLNVKTIEDVLGSVSNLVARECAIITKESFAKLLVLKIRKYPYEIYSEYVLHFYNPEDAFEPFCEKANEILTQAQRISNYRMAQRASRGQWVGGGFGLKGAIKGAATAGALNAASGVFHGITDAVTNASDKAKLKKMMAVDDQQVQEYFKNVMGKYVDAVYNAERITLVQYGYLEEYNRDTSKTDIVLENTETVFKMALGQKIETAVRATYDYLDAAIDCIQLNPFYDSYYKIIYQCGMIMKRVSPEYSRIIIDLFEFAEFFGMTEICKEYVKSENEDAAKPYLSRIQEQPEDAEEIYEEFQEEVRKLQKDNPFYTQAIIENVKSVKCRVVEEYHETIRKNNEKENFKREYVKYYDWLLKGRVRELWNVANKNNPIAQYILARYYIENVLGETLTDSEIDNSKICECILREVEVYGGKSDFSVFVKNSIQEKRAYSRSVDEEKVEEEMAGLARKAHPCINAVAYAGLQDIELGKRNEGIRYLKNAAEVFSPLALAWYGSYLFTGENGVQIDKEKAQYYLEAAAFAGQRQALQLNQKYKWGYEVYCPKNSAGEKLHIKADGGCFCDRGGRTELIKFPMGIVHRYYFRLICAQKSICLNDGKELTDEQHVTEVKKSLLIPENEKVYFAVTANVMGYSKKDMSGLAIGTRGVYLRETGIIKKRYTILWDDFKKAHINVNDRLCVEKCLIMVPTIIEKTMFFLLRDLQSLCSSFNDIAEQLEEDDDENLLDEELKSRNVIELTDTIPSEVEKSSVTRNDDGISQAAEEDFWEDADENELDKDMLAINEERAVEKSKEVPIENSAEKSTEKKVISNTDASPINEELLEIGELNQTTDISKVSGAQQAKGKCCPSCQKMNKATAKFCSGCGFTFEMETICKQCGNKIKPGKKFCSACGAKVEN